MRVSLLRKNFKGSGLFAVSFLQILECLAKKAGVSIFVKKDVAAISLPLGRSLTQLI